MIPDAVGFGRTRRSVDQFQCRPEVTRVRVDQDQENHDADNTARFLAWVGLSVVLYGIVDAHIVYKRKR
ncbi:hypothetical protein BSFP_056940 [Burkholderia stabilis]|uniref:Uncharacterized protein n=1 Tax=Burkholderia stabilis TaxID=95485 RepID=A0A1Y1BUM1_9BURK|nr:hypothetical protein BSFP_056940 [Burkholderia stabilis]